MTDRELMQMALEALDSKHDMTKAEWRVLQYHAFTALREALAQLNDFSPDWDAMAVMVEEQQRMAKRIEELEAALAQLEPVIQARKEGDLIVVDLPQVPTGGGGISKDEQPEPTLPGGGGGSGVLTIDGWPLYSVLSTQEEQGLTAIPLPAIKLQDERESQYKSFAQSAQVIGIPKKEWVGLTKEGYEAMAEKCVTNCYFDTLKYARAIEARLHDKNS